MSHAQSQVNSWLAQLGAQSGASFSLNEQGCCLMTAANGVELELFATETSGRFFLSATLLKLPQGNHNAIYFKALSLNLFMQDTRGAAVALDDQAGELVLCYSHQIEGCEFTVFQNVIQNFVETTETMKGHLKLMEQNEQNPAVTQHQAMSFGAPPAERSEPIYDNSNPMINVMNLV